MLERATVLSDRELEAIAELERRVVDADGGRLKLEWGTLRERAGERLLWWEDERLLGFLGLYSFGSWVELAGMVATDARRRGIATRLLDAAEPLYAAAAYHRVLLIVPRASLAGRRLAERRGGVLDHSEHALVLAGAPAGGPRETGLTMRPAVDEDVPLLARLLEEGFGHPAPDLTARLQSPGERTVVLEHGEAAVGTLRAVRDGPEAGIYGFVIDEPWQGRGLGRSALWQTCEQLRAEGAQRIRLEVAVENDRALGLYTSVGFAPVTTEDYYALPRE